MINCFKTVSGLANSAYIENTINALDNYWLGFGVALRVDEHRRAVALTYNEQERAQPLMNTVNSTQPLQIINQTQPACGTSLYL
jgi:hypothetical protein